MRPFSYLTGFRCADCVRGGTAPRRKDSIATQCRCIEVVSEIALRYQPCLRCSKTRARNSIVYIYCTVTYFLDKSSKSPACLHSGIYLLISNVANLYRVIFILSCANLSHGTLVWRPPRSSPELASSQHWTKVPKPHLLILYRSLASDHDG